MYQLEPINSNWSLVSDDDKNIFFVYEYLQTVVHAYYTGNVPIGHGWPCLVSRVFWLVDLGLTAL